MGFELEFTPPQLNVLALSYHAPISVFYSISLSQLVSIHKTAGVIYRNQNLIRKMN